MVFMFYIITLEFYVQMFYRADILQIPCLMKSWIMPTTILLIIFSLTAYVGILHMQACAKYLQFAFMERVIYRTLLYTCRYPR